MINKNNRKIRLDIFKKVIEKLEEDNAFIIDEQVSIIIAESIKHYLLLCEAT